MEPKQKTASRSQARKNAHAAVAGARANRHEVIERIYQEWDAALSRSDVEELLALYAADAVLESPLVSYLMNKEVGICRGHDELRPLFEMLRERKPRSVNIIAPAISRMGKDSSGNILVSPRRANRWTLSR
jgi:hypothetical protein